MIKIEFLFPEICGIYGDSINAEYLSMCNKDTELIKDDIDKKPYFVSHKVDMIYMGAMMESNQEVVIDRLMPYKQRLSKLIEDGVIFVTTNNATEIFGNYIERYNKKIECLGLLDFNTKYDYKHRHNSHFLGKFEETEIIGFKTQYSMIYDRKVDGLFSITKGVGNNPEDEYEGVRKNNFMGTALLGPLFIQNPLFVKEILKMLGLKDKLKYETEIMDAYKDRSIGYNHFLLGK